MTSALAYLLALMALLGGSLILSLVYEKVAGNESFSLPFANVLVVTVIGMVLFVFFGYLSIVIILTLYGAIGVIGGLMERRSS